MPPTERQVRIVPQGEIKPVSAGTEDFFISNRLMERHQNGIAATDHAFFNLHVLSCIAEWEIGH